MPFSTWVIFATLFKGTCFVTTIYTIGYWFDAYAIKDEDLAVIDYELVEKTQENELPVVSLCFYAPFSDAKLKGINSNISRGLYHDYLGGEIFDEIFAHIDYNNISYNLSEDFLYGKVVWRNGSGSNILIHNSRTDALIKRSIKVTFNGFIWF